MALDYSPTNVDKSLVKSHLMKQLIAIDRRLPLDVLVAAPPYGDYQQQECQYETEDDATIAKVVSDQLVLPPRTIHLECSSSPSISLRPGSRSSNESIGSVPISLLKADTAFWRSQQPFYHNTTSQKSDLQSPASERIASLEQPLDTLVTAYMEERGGARISSGVDGKDFAAQPESSPDSIEKADFSLIHTTATEGERGFERISKMNARVETTSLSGAVRTEVPPKPFKDSESLRHEDVLEKRSSMSPARNFVKIASIVVAFLAFLALVFVLCFHKDKKMARAAILGCTTVAYFCVGAGMWAAERTMVETFIAMNLVVVYGIFVNGQVDVFLGYAATT